MKEVDGNKGVAQYVGDSLMLSRILPEKNQLVL